MKLHLRLLSLCVTLLALGGGAKAQLTGVKTVPSTSYPTLAVAIDSMNLYGVGTGGVTINVTAAQTAPTGGYRLGSATLNASTSSGNPVTINGNGNVVTPYTGTGSTDGIFYIMGTDYVTIKTLNLVETSANTSTTTQMEWGYSLVKLSSTAPYDGCQNVVIDGCTIVLTGTNSSTIGIRAAHTLAGSSSTLSTSGATAASTNSYNTFTRNSLSEIVRGFSLVGISSPAAVYDKDNKIGGATSGSGNTIVLGAANGTLTMYGTYTQYDSVISIRNNSISLATGTTSSAARYLIYMATGVGDLNVTDNNLNLTCNQTSGSVYAYYNYGISSGHRDPTSSPQGMLSTHTITGNTITGTNTNTGISTLYGIYEYYTYCKVMNISKNSVQNVTWNASSFYGYYTGYSGCPYITIEDNKFVNVSNTYASGQTMGFYLYHYNSTFGVFSLKRNIVRNLTSRYFTYPYYVFASYTAAPSGYTAQKYICHNNIADSLDLSTATTAYVYDYLAYYGMDSTEVKYNTLTNVKGSATGTSYVYFQTYGYYGPKSYKVIGNTISNITGFNLYNNFYLGYYATHVDSNTISNISNTGSNGYVFNYLGYYGSNVSASYNKVTNINLIGSAYFYNYVGYYCSGADVHHNRFDSLSWGTGTSYPFMSYANGAPSNIYNNIISNLSWTSTSVTVYPYYLYGTSLSTPVNFYNNFLTNLNPPAAYANTNSAGVYLPSAATYNLSHNTIYINPGIAGGTGYGFTGIYYPSSCLLDLRNNIINVNVTPTGTGFTTALRRNTGSTGVSPSNFLGTSNGNIYYTPPGTNSWYYGEGTSSGSLVNTYHLSNDANFNTPCGLFKSFLGHDQASFTENRLTAGAIPATYVPFGTSYAEKGSVPTSSPVVTIDYANVTRPAVADIGALEFSGTALDNAPPIISYTPLATRSYCATCPTLNVTITDNSGVNNTPGTAPRLYYKKSSENNAFGGNTSSFNGWKYVEASTVSGSLYTFVFDCSLLTSSLSAGDSVTYFVIAQDNASPVNAGASVAAFNVCPTTVVLTNTNAPVKSSPFPNGFKVLATPNFAINAFPNSSCGSGSSTMTVMPTPVGATVQWQTATLTGTFANITGATNTSYTTPVNTTTLRYRALILCGTSTLATTKIDTFVIANPSIVSTKGDTLCGYGQHNLIANPAPFTTPYWFTSATGGLPIATGNTFTTPFINSTQTYYVGANTPNASTEVLNCPVAPAPYSYGLINNSGMELTFKNPSTHFYSTTIYPYNAGGGSTLDFELWDAATGGPVPASAGGPYVLSGVPVSGGNGSTPQVVMLPFRNIKPGKYLLMITNPVGTPYLNFQYIGSTPMPISTPSGNVTATNGIYSGSYYNYYWMFFYNNVFGADCLGGTRIPVVATVTPAPAITVSSPGIPGICSGTSTTIGVTSPNSSYVFTWTPGPLTGASHTVSPTTTTTYDLIATDPYTGCVNHDSIKLFVNPQPTPPVLSPTNPTICQNNSVLLNAAAPLGASYTATIGTGTSSYGSGYSLWFPFGGYYMGQHSQYLIRASELTAAGVRKGALTSVAFDQITPPSSAIATYTMRMAPTALTGLAGSFVNTGFTTVANLTAVSFSGTGWKTITFSTPFIWDGVSNVVLDIAQNNCTSCPTSMCSAVYGQSGDVRYTSTSFTSVLYGYSYGGCDVASFTPTQNWYGTYSTTARPNMFFNWRAPADVNWLNVTGLYKNAALTNTVSLTDTNSNVYASPATTTVYTAITNFQGCKSAPSLPDTVNVIPAPVVTVTPAGPQTICAGQPVTLCIPTGANQTYQWYLNNVAITVNGNANCYVASAAGTYKVTATNIVTGCSSTSIPTVLTVNPVPTVSISANGPTTFCYGSSVGLTANSGTAVAWQWALNGVNIPGATSSSYTATDSGNYTVTVTNTSSCFNTSAVLKVTVKVVPDTVMPQSSTSFCTGDSVDLQAPVGATLSYQWYDGSGPLTNDTLSMYRAKTTGNYYVVVTDNATGCSSTSKSIAVTVGAGPNASITPQGIVQGCQGGTVTLNAVKQPGLCYQWNLNSTPIPGANSDFLVVSAAGNYTVTVSICATTCASTSATATTVNLNPLPNASVTPSTATPICQGDSVVLNANTAAGITYQWYLNSLPVSGATSSSLAAKNNGDYRVLVTNTTTGCQDTSAKVSVTVKAGPNTTITPASNPTFCQGGSVVLNAATSGITGYQWYLNGSPAPGGSTSSSYTATATGLYSVKLTGSNSCVATSPTTSVQVNALPDVTTVPTGNAAVCQGYTTQLAVAAGPGLTYQWYNGTTPISGATNNTYTTGTAGTYNVKVVNTVTGCFATSGNIVLSVNTPPTASASATGSTTICEDDSVKLSANAGAGLTYQWKFNGVDIVGGTGSDFYAKAGGRYTVSVSSAANCTTLSNSIQITVNPRPAAYITYNTPLEFCEGSAVVLNANVGTGLTYQWYMDGVALTNTSNVNVSSVSGKYTLKVTNSFLCANTADTLDVTVWAKPVPVITRTGSTLSTSQPYASYQWFYNNNAVGGATSATHTFTQNGAYKVRVIDDNGCEGFSNQYFVNNVGITPTTAGRSVKVYPNPSNGIVHIDASVKIKVALRDVTGRTILEEKDVKEIDLGDVATGTYLLYISDMEGNLLRVEKLTKSDR